MNITALPETEIVRLAHLIRLPQVTAITGQSRSQIYALVKQGRFPAPIKLSERSSAWVSAEVADWITARIAASRGQAKAGGSK